jgi:dipeptidyl aminopeptidase/acylaminoacyl peptidase
MVKLIPRSVLFGNPAKASPQLSPDGTRMSFLAPVENVLNVWVGTVGRDDAKPVTNDRDRGVMHYFWSEDNRHLFYLQDKDGNENWRLHAVDLQTQTIRDLTPFDNVQVQVVDRNKHFPDELLIAMNKDNEQLHDVYHLDIPTGKLLLVAKNPGNVAGWVTDAELIVRGAVVALPDGGLELQVCKSPDTDWTPTVRWDSADALNSGPVCFSKDGRTIYLKDSRNVNAARLVALDLETGASQVLAQDPEYDVAGLMIHPDRYEIQAVEFVKARAEWSILDKSIEKDIAAIRGLHHGEFFLADRDSADEHWLVGFMADNGPVPYYAWDRKKQAATFLFDHKPALKEYTLALMEPVSFSSRDGLTIHGYISFPPDAEQKNLPMVLNVHGGPWSRDTWGYDAEAQWLANRGYACLQVNFRGSTGYGKGFLNAGDREWGGKMHNDLVDAIHWAVDRGYADPKRIAIYGGSYGGYAALVGATFTPDLFSCAVAIVGPSNLITFIRSVPPYWSTFLAMLHQRVGNPDTEEAFLVSRSPLSRVNQIKIPMLIAQGANDPRVKQAESEQIVQAMRDKNIDHEYLLFPDEGHGFGKPENRIRFYAAAEKFLARHLGGRYEE